MQHFDDSPEGLKHTSRMVAESALEYMYKHCSTQPPQNARLLELAQTIIRHFPANTRGCHQMNDMARAMVTFIHSHYLLQLLQKPPQQLVSETCMNLRERVETEKRNLFSMMDPALMLYLDGLLDPFLFPHNLPVLFSEVAFCSWCLRSIYMCSRVT